MRAAWHVRVFSKQMENGLSWSEPEGKKRDAPKRYELELPLLRERGRARPGAVATSVLRQQWASRAVQLQLEVWMDVAAAVPDVLSWFRLG